MTRWNNIPSMVWQFWRKIQYLADIRNLCAHKKNEEATEEQVSELIDGVNGIVKTVHWAGNAIQLNGGNAE